MEGKGMGDGEWNRPLAVAEVRRVEQTCARIAFGPGRPANRPLRLLTSSPPRATGQDVRFEAFQDDAAFLRDCAEEVLNRPESETKGLMGQLHRQMGEPQNAHVRSETRPDQEHGTEFSRTNAADPNGALRVQGPSQPVLRGKVIGWRSAPGVCG